MSIIRKPIGVIYRNILKPILFTQDPEKIHDRFIKIGEWLGKHKVTRKTTNFFFHYKNPKLEQEILDLKFENPLGLSEGFDKDAKLLKIIPETGFGYMQIGSITLHSYKGNTGERLKRLKKSKSLLVNYGLKNEGVEEILPRVKKFKNKDFPVGISIAKTNCEETANEEKGIEDYSECLRKCTKENVGDFYTLNISCPNTFGGEPFTKKHSLEKLLEKINTIKNEKPIFIKMPIDLKWPEFKELMDIIIKHKIEGVIIGNLTKERNKEKIKDHLPAEAKGGLSGKITWELSNELISETYKHYSNKVIIIGVGGVFTAEDAYEKIKRGASLIQLVTGMIFMGPQQIAEINEGLVKLLEKDGYNNISEAIGAYYK